MSWAHLEGLTGADLGCVMPGVRPTRRREAARRFHTRGVPRAKGAELRLLTHSHFWELGLALRFAMAAAHLEGIVSCPKTNAATTDNRDSTTIPRRVPSAVTPRAHGEDGLQFLLGFNG